MIYNYVTTMNLVKHWTATLRLSIHIFVAKVSNHWWVWSENIAALPHVIPVTRQTFSTYLFMMVFQHGGTCSISGTLGMISFY